MKIIFYLEHRIRTSKSQVLRCVPLHTLQDNLAWTVGTAATDFFASENGKLQSFLRWNFAFQNFDNNVASTQDGFITIPNDSLAASFYMKATVNEQWYYFSRAFGNISVVNMHDTEYAPGRLVAALLTTSTRVTLFNQTIDQKFIMHLGRNFRTGTLPANFSAMRGISSTKLRYKEVSAQVELKIDLSKLRH